MSNPSEPGILIIDVLGPCESTAYRWEIEISEYEGEGCDRIQEGIGFDYFVDGLEEINSVGRWLIEGIVVTYYPAESWFEEADEDIEISRISQVAADYAFI